MERKVRKKILKIRDTHGGSLEIQVLKSNNEIAEDLIWLHVKRGGKKGEETGFVMQPWEARDIIHGLFLAIDYIIEKYKLEKWKL